MSGPGAPEAIDIAARIPHTGAMCLLASVASWSDDAIACRATSHLDPGNPLRRRGRLSTLAGIEYALQAAALHASLRGGVPQRAGYLAGLRMDRIATERLDDPAWGTLAVDARCDYRDAIGAIYAIRLAAQGGRVLLEGRATLIVQRP